MSEVKRYGHIGYLVNASDKLCKLYPDMTVYVKASDYDAAQRDLAALREELAACKKNSERYLWLRDVCTDGDIQSGLHWLGSFETTDEIIDAHMAAGTTEGYAKTTESGASE